MQYYIQYIKYYTNYRPDFAMHKLLKLNFYLQQFLNQTVCLEKRRYSTYCNLPDGLTTNSYSASVTLYEAIKLYVLYIACSKCKLNLKEPSKVQTITTLLDIFSYSPAVVRSSFIFDDKAIRNSTSVSLVLL